jgi:hypothetical protein
MGRPPGRIQDRSFQMRLSGEFLERLDEWRRKQPEPPSRAEAIRRLTTAMLHILAKDPGEKSSKPMKLFAWSKPKMSSPDIGKVGGANSAIWQSTSRDEKKPLTSPQIRAARALIRWTAEDLSQQSSVSLRTIRRAELAERHTTMTAANDLAIRRALESAGVEFIDENGGGLGLRLRKTHQQGMRKYPPSCPP